MKITKIMCVCSCRIKNHLSMAECVLEIIWSYNTSKQHYLSIIPYGKSSETIENCVNNYGCDCSSNAVSVDFYFHTLKNILYLYFLKCYEKSSIELLKKYIFDNFLCNIDNIYSVGVVTINNIAHVNHIFSDKILSVIYKNTFTGKSFDFCKWSPCIPQIYLNHFYEIMPDLSFVDIVNEIKNECAKIPKFEEIEYNYLSSTTVIYNKIKNTLVLKKMLASQIIFDVNFVGITRYDDIITYDCDKEQLITTDDYVVDSRIVRRLEKESVIYKNYGYVSLELFQITEQYLYDFITRYDKITYTKQNIDNFVAIYDYYCLSFPFYEHIFSKYVLKYSSLLENTKNSTKMIEIATNFFLHFMDPYQKYDIPPSYYDYNYICDNIEIEEIHIVDFCDDELNLPNKIKGIVFGRNYNTPIKLPEGLLWVEFGDHYNCVTRFPDSIERIRFGDSYREKTILPKNVKEVIFPDHYPHSVIIHVGCKTNLPKEKQILE